MSKKFILTSSGSFIEDLITYDQNSGILNINNLNILENISCSFDGLITIKNGVINSSIAKYSTVNSLFQSVTGSTPVINTSQVYGDLSGSFGGKITISSVSNVTGGILLSNNGGTGLQASATGLIVKDNLNNITTLNTDVSGSALRYTQTGWSAYNNISIVEYQPRLDVYTSNHTWTKTGNPKFIKVIVIGGGGGGGGGGKKGGNTYNTYYWGGAGGGAGGVSVSILDATLITSCIIQIGAGGTGGAGNSGGAGAGANGTSGGTTSAIFNNGLDISATGGAGGYRGYASIVGTYVSTNGGAGTYENDIASNFIAAITPGNGENGIYVSGGGQGGTVYSSGRWAGGNGGVAAMDATSYSAGRSEGVTPTNSFGLVYFGVSEHFLNNVKNTGLLSYLGRGGAGSAGAYSSATVVFPANGIFGGGGGGGGSLWTTGTASKGGDGGNGIVMIYSY